MSFIVKNKKLLARKIKFVNKYFLSHVRLVDSMRFVFGINYFIAFQICKSYGFSLNLKIGSIDPKILFKISDFFLSYLLVERGLKRYRNTLLLDRKNNGCVRGMRLLSGLPINGQRSHTNAMTVRKMFKFYKFEE